MWKCNPTDVEMIWNMQHLKAGKGKIESAIMRVIINIITNTLNSM